MENFVTTVTIDQYALGFVVSRTVVMGEELADAQLVQPVRDGDHVYVHVIHIPVHVSFFWRAHYERPESAVTALTPGVRVPEVRALVVCQVHVTERTVRRHRALRHVGDTVHVRRVTLMVSVPMDGR